MRKVVIIALCLVAGVIGFRVADLLDAYNPELGPAMLGLATVYSLYRYGLLPMRQQPLTTIFAFPNYLKLLLYVFVIAAFADWAFQQIFAFAFALR